MCVYKKMNVYNPCYKIRMYPTLFCILALYGLDVTTRRLCYMFRHPNEVSNRLSCIAFQCFILSHICNTLITYTLKDGLLFWTHTSLLRSETKHMEHYMAGYFIYDLIILLSTERGRRQKAFLAHHVVSLTIYGVNQYHPCGNDVFNNTIILLLESSSPFMNFWKIAEEINRTGYMTRILFFLTKMTYFMSRMVGMSVWLVFYFMTQYRLTWTHTLNASSFIMVYLASIQWFRMLRLK
jgi:hypothetical protein